ncbi:MAG: hypothetical protein Q7T48_10540 [Cellvibrio sp.]|uniref:hypothetical protein n=1 Tax=Cellvibrio sp. TaxID=1965322 RepID=UPI00271C2C2F|nr:hypothetical protein [Cellvibrio sp.]
MIYTEREGGFEFARPPSLNLAVLLLMEALLLSGGIYCLVTVDSPANYFIASALLFFFLLIASAVFPAIHAYKKGSNIFVWGANKKGLLVAARESSFAQYHPPLVFPWESIYQIVFAKALIDRTVSFETSISNNVLVIELANKKRMLFSYPEVFEQNLFDFFSSAGHCDKGTSRANEFEIF